MEEYQVFWRTNPVEGVTCVVKTPWGDVDITEGVEFLKDDWAWRVMYFSESGVVCEVEESNTGLVLSPSLVALHLLTTNHGFS